MDVKITFLGGESYLLMMQPGTTVDYLKTLICARSHHPPESQRLIYESNGQKINLDDASKSLSAYGLQSGANISVLVTEPSLDVQVFLRTEKGQTHTYVIPPGETVADFKRKVREMEGVAEDQQRLIHEGKQMDDGRRTLESYRVKAESTIFLTGQLRGG